MATWHTLRLFPAAILIALSLSAGCGGKSDENASSGGGSAEGGASQGGVGQGGGARPGATGGKSFGGAPSTGGSTTAGGSGGVGGGCVYNGKTYQVGETFKQDCNTCTCFGMNGVACTLIACPDTCETAQFAFTNAIAEAKRCDPTLGTAQQCRLYETADLLCGCPTFVNPANGEALMEASSWRDTYLQNQCGQGIACGVCLEPRRGFCSPSGVCEDIYDAGGASCLVNGKVYPHGATGIKDPFSCNSCQCSDGRLGCTEIGCQTPCPPDTTHGERCALCGFADGCDVIETGCLPVCDGTCPNAGDACVNGVCTMQCG
jgi:hypothetical protein